MGWGVVGELMRLTRTIRIAVEIMARRSKVMVVETPCAGGRVSVQPSFHPYVITCLHDHQMSAKDSLNPKT